MLSQSHPLASTPVADLWATLPELVDEVNPFLLTERLAVFKRLIDATNRAGIFGEDNRYNVFWAYLFQTHWQGSSGRYTLADTPPGGIDPNSLWGFGNSSLSLIPLIAATQVGLTPEIAILPPPAPAHVEYAQGGGAAGGYRIPASFAPAVAEWRHFFELVAATKPDADLEPIRFALWKAHEQSLIAAGKGAAPLRASCSEQEFAFFTGWIRMVDFLSAAAWRTDLEYMLTNGLGMLPERMLTDGDVPGRVQDMNDQVNSNLKSILSLVALPSWRFSFNRWLWRRAMRTRAARDEVLPMLDATFHPSPSNRKERGRLLRYILKP